MSSRRGLPTTARMRHDAHFVEELASQHTNAIGRSIPVAAIRPNPEQPRKTFERLDELIASIRRVGVLQPLLVRRVGVEYQIVSGERRYRAARAAGLREVPCIVLELDDARTLEVALIENLQRQDLSAFEEAEGLQALVDRFGLTHEEVALRVSKSRTSVTESLALATVPESVRKVLGDGGVRTKSILLEIAKQESEAVMLALARRVVEDGLTRDQVRQLVRDQRSLAERRARDDEQDKKGGPRRFSFKSSDGITVRIFLGSDERSISNVERALLEALRQLRSGGLLDRPEGTARPAAQPAAPETGA